MAQPERFGVVFDRYHAAIWAFLARHAGRDAADELAGDVFVAAFRNRQRYDPACGTVRAWLYGIAINLQRTRLRSDARQARALERVAGGMTAVVIPIEAAEDVLDGRQELERVRRHGVSVRSASRGPRAVRVGSSFPTMRSRRPSAWRSGP